MMFVASPPVFSGQAFLPRGRRAGFYPGVICYSPSGFRPAIAVGR